MQNFKLFLADIFNESFYGRILHILHLNNKERNEAFTGQTIMHIFHCTYHTIVSVVVCKTHSNSAVSAVESYSVTVLIRLLILGGRKSTS